MADAAYSLRITLPSGKTCDVTLAQGVRVLEVPASAAYAPHMLFSNGGEAKEKLQLRVFSSGGDRNMEVQKTTLSADGKKEQNIRATDYRNTFGGIFGGTWPTLRHDLDKPPEHVDYTMGEPQGIALTVEVLKKLGVLCTNDTSAPILNYRNAQAIQQHISASK